MPSQGNCLLLWSATTSSSGSMAYKWSKTKWIFQVIAEVAWQFEDLVVALLLNLSVPQTEWAFWFPLMLSPGDNNGNYCCFAVPCRIRLASQERIGRLFTTSQIILHVGVKKNNLDHCNLINFFFFLPLQGLLENGGKIVYGDIWELGVWIWDFL